MIEVKQGDYGFDLTFEIKNSDGSEFDLDGYTATLKVWKQDGTILFSGACDIDNASEGLCHYNIQSGDFDTLDNPQLSGITRYSDYVAEIELTKSGVILSTPSFIIRVWESE